MKLSVNISKITPPVLPQILNRLRLLNLLDESKDKKLILILGQAAQGKTTLAASWVQTSKTPFAWINLDNEDSDAVRLFELLTQSLQHTLNHLDFSRLLSYPLGTLGPGARTLPLRDWSSLISEVVTVPVRIVLDGLDRLSSDGSAFQLLDLLIKEASPNVRFVSLSRNVPPLPLELERLEVMQEALVLTNEDLAFNQDETRDYFRTIRKIPLTPKQLKRVYSATEGWAGGLILFSESLSRFAGGAGEQYISGILPPRFKREVFQYLGNEILAAQPQSDQEFLLRSCIVDIVEPRFMKDLLGIENAELILREHVRKNLFVQCFYDEQKGWLFRYHQLFRNFLRAKFDSEIGEEEKRSFLLKAASLYEGRGELETALKYFIDAKAYPQAASIIERLGTDLLRQGRSQDLSRWIEALPEEIVEEDPWLLFYQAMTRRYRAGRENVVFLQKALKIFNQKGNTRGILLSLAQLMTMSISTGIHLVPLEQLLRDAETWLQKPDLEKYAYERAMLYYCVGSAHVMGDGDVRKGIWFCQNAYLFSKPLGDLWLQAYALVFAMFGLTFVGEYSSAHESLAKLRRLIERSAHPELHAVGMMLEASFANYRGDLVAVRDVLQRLKRYIEEHSLTFVAPWVQEISGMLSIAQGNYAEAEQVGRSYVNVTLAVNNPFFRGLALRLLGMAQFYLGKFSEAKEMLEQSLQVLSQEALSKYELHRVKLILGLITMCLKDYSRAERELNEALQYFLSVSSHMSLAMTHFVSSLLKWEQGKREEASLHLQSGLRIAEEKEYDYFYYLGPPYLMKVCLLAIELKIEDSLNYVICLLSGRLAPWAREDLKKLAEHPDPWVRDQVWEIRKTIHRSRVPRLRIQTLGGLHVFRESARIRDEDWDRAQPKQLFKALVSHGGVRVPKDVLMDALWPEEGPKAAENNFKTTLQRLRKSLEPSVPSEFGSSYVHLDDHLVTLDQELCEVDVDNFLMSIKRGEEQEKAGDPKSALSSYTEATEIYKGDFLPEEVYAPWANMKREELRQRYIDLLSKICELHEKQGALRKATEWCRKVITADPLMEDSYQKLMTLYFNRGMFNEALRVYDECKKVLKTELKTTPDTVTTSLYEKILEKIREK